MQTKSDIQPIQKGKLPPQAVDVEEAIIGALMVDHRGAYEVINILFPEAFYKEAHKEIFQVIEVLFKNNEPIDLLTVSSALKTKGKLEKVGGDYELIKFTQKVASSAHIEYHARIILQKYIQRSLIRISSTLIENSYSEDADVFDLLDEAYNGLNEVSEQSIQKSEIPFYDIVENQITKGRKIYNGDIKPGIVTPISKLSKKTGGWRPTELIILAARPGMGKTSFALSLAIHAAKNQIPVAVFSLEMSKEKLTDRIISMEASIDGEKFNIHGLSNDDLISIEKVKSNIQKMPMHIDDTSSLSIEQFQVKAKILKRKHKISLILVDYLQLMTAGGQRNGNREQEISKISRGLKKVAMELELPIIALSQLSRSVETRSDKRPMLSDLRESGAIEQDADMVVFLYRPEYYGIEYWDDYDGVPTENECEYLVAKNRNGGLIRSRMRFEPRYTRFSDLESEFKEPDIIKNINVDPLDAFDVAEQKNDFPF